MEGNEAAYRLAKGGADLEGGAMATIKAATRRHEERRGASIRKPKKQICNQSTEEINKSSR